LGAGGSLELQLVSEGVVSQCEVGSQISLEIGNLLDAGNELVVDGLL
jgi:hypothetical protein